MENSSKINLLEQPAQLPLPRFVNGWRLVPEFYAPLFGDYRVYWYVVPRRFNKKFCFSSLRHISDFALKYKDCHTFVFWSKVYCPVYSLEQVQKFI